MYITCVLYHMLYHTVVYYWGIYGMWMRSGSTIQFPSRILVEFHSRLRAVPLLRVFHNNGPWDLAAFDQDFDQNVGCSNN